MGSRYVMLPANEKLCRVKNYKYFLNNGTGSRRTPAEPWESSDSGKQNKSKIVTSDPTKPSVSS